MKNLIPPSIDELAKICAKGYAEDFLSSYVDINFQKIHDHYVWAYPISNKLKFIDSGQKVHDNDKKLGFYCAPANSGITLILKAGEIYEKTRSERFWRSICSLPTFVNLRILGNRNNLFLAILANHAYIESISSTIETIFPTIAVCRSNLLFWDELNNPKLNIFDFYPIASFHECLEPGNADDFALERVYKAISLCENGSIAGVDILISPTLKNYSKLIKGMYEFHYKSTIELSYSAFSRNVQDPSLYLPEYYRKSEKKFKEPHFYCKIMVFSSSQHQPVLDLLNSYTDSYTYGGKKLDKRSINDFSEGQLQQCLIKGKSHTYPMLLTVEELAQVAHFISLPKQIECIHPSVKINSFLPIPEKLKNIQGKTILGSNYYEGKRINISVSKRYNRNYLLCGDIGVGKTCLGIHCMCQDAANGLGFIFIDPDGTSAPLLMQRLPESALDRVIYFDISLHSYHLLWNFLNQIQSYPSIFAEWFAEIIRVVFFDPDQRIHTWGLNIDDFFRQSLEILYLAEEPFKSIGILASSGSKFNSQKRKSILSNLTSNEAKQYWFEHYPSLVKKGYDLPAKSRVNQLIQNYYLARLFSNTDSSFSMSTVMENNMIIIASLPASVISDKATNICGALLLGTAYFERRRQKYDKPFSVYIDEFHRFSSSKIYESILTQGRKLSFFLRLMNQSLSQIESNVKGVLSNCQVKATFRIGIGGDAEYFSKEYKDLVQPHHFLNLEDREAVVKIGNLVTSIRTDDLPPADPAKEEYIIKHSIEKYYKPTSELVAPTNDTQPVKRDSFDEIIISGR